MSGRRVALLFGVLLVQAGLLVLAVWPQFSPRLTGHEVRLRVAPLDPVDPFRGAYVQLRYLDLPASTFDPDRPDDARPGPSEERRGAAYVPLSPRGEHWVGGPIVRDRPRQGLYLACDDSSFQLRCGIEQWFLPQDEAAAAETTGRVGPATVLVDDRGHAAIVHVD